MRRLIGAIGGALALGFFAQTFQADAVSGYDSAYAGESAFVHIAAGQTANFQVFFANSGTTAWTRGTNTQVDLAACLEDKITCNAQDSSEAAWNNGWLSPVRYATQAQSVVAPGLIGTFSYNITAPAAVSAGNYRFNGDVVLAATGERIHPEGYYQDATVATTTTPPPPPGDGGGGGGGGGGCGTVSGSTATTYTGTSGTVTGTGTATAPTCFTVTDVSAAWDNTSGTGGTMTGTSGTLQCTANVPPFDSSNETFTCTGVVSGPATNVLTITTTGFYTNGTTSTETDTLP